MIINTYIVLRLATITHLTQFAGVQGVTTGLCGNAQNVPLLFALFPCRFEVTSSLLTVILRLRSLLRHCRNAANYTKTLLLFYRLPCILLRCTHRKTHCTAVPCTLVQLNFFKMLQTPFLCPSCI